MQTAARLLFMGLVTGYLLGRMFTGVASPAETFVYAGTAALGLEFLLTSWGELWRSADRA